MKRIGIFILLISLLLTNCIQAQRSYETNPERKRTFNWLFGNKVWLDYNFNSPHLLNGSKLIAFESATSISDTSGKLLFYSDGVSIWNANHSLIINGTGLNGDISSSQGALFVTHPTIDTIIYLFTTAAQGGANGLQVTTIAINRNLDSSRVIEKNIPLITPVCESISSIQHQNGKYTWITVHSKLGNTFYSYLISSAGISTCPVISNQGLVYDGHILNCQTISKFSADGKRFAITLFNNDKVSLLNFDNSTGKFKEIKQFSNISIPTGIAFSNNDSLLYMIERSKQINQYNINKNQNLIVKSIAGKFNIIQIEKAPNGELNINI